MEEKTNKLSKSEKNKIRIDNIIKFAFSKNLNDGLLLTLYLKCKINPETLSQLRITDFTFHPRYIKSSQIKRIEIPEEILIIFANFIKQKPIGYVFESNGDPILPEKIEELYQSYQMMYNTQFLDKFKDIIRKIEQKTLSEQYTIKLSQIKKYFLAYYGINLSSNKIIQLIKSWEKTHNIIIPKLKPGVYIVKNNQF